MSDSARSRQGNQEPVAVVEKAEQEGCAYKVCVASQPTLADRKVEPALSGAMSVLNSSPWTGQIAPWGQTFSCGEGRGNNSTHAYPTTPPKIALDSYIVSSVKVKTSSETTACKSTCTSTAICRHQQVPRAPLRLTECIQMPGHSNRSSF